MRTDAAVGCWTQLGRTFLAVLATLGLLVSVGSPQAFADELVVQGEYILQRRPARPGDQRSVSKKQYAVQSASKFFEVVSVGAHVRPQGASARLVPLDRAVVERDCAGIRSDPTVRTCEPNVVRRFLATPNDTNFSSQWALNSAANSDINAPEAWDYGTGTKSTLIGVIDSGVHGAHPDLAVNLWANPNDPADGQDNDGNGYVDDVFGGNTHFGTGSPADCNGHGTHVSGIIGAVGNNNTGISGINWTTSLIVASIAMDCSGSASVASVIRAYDYFTDLKNRGHDVRVINASYGGNAFLSAEFSAIDRLRAADVLLVAAAGNSNVNSDTTPSYPANYELSNIINVGATGPTRQRAAYSNFGQTVDIAAPGGDSDFSNGTIYSTWSPLATGGLLYQAIEGTSMAAPMVTGAVGLLASLQPTLSGAAMKKMVLDSADLVPELTAAVAGGRFLNVAALVAHVAPGDSCPTDPAKLEPGVCGCGIADTDGNNNGRWDCLESDVAEARPPKPALRAVGKRVAVVMQQRSGVEYYVEAISSPPKGSRKRLRTSYYLSRTGTGTFPKPAKGFTLKVRYAYRVVGDAADFSYWSPYATLRIKK